MRILTSALGVLATGIVLSSPVLAVPQCAPTNRVATINYPGAANIPTTNNLLQPTGKAVPAQGQRLILKGRVVDSRCVPVSEAAVELWQNNPYGKWLLAGKDDLASSGPVFAGAGRTYTDMDGTFTFITAFPAPLAKRAPFLNLKVKAANQATITTALFFSEDVRNETDKVYKKLSPATRGSNTIQMHQDENGDLVGTIDIAVSGRAKYKTY